MSGDSSGTLALTDEIKLDGGMQSPPLQGQLHQSNKNGSHLGRKSCKRFLELLFSNQIKFGAGHRQHNQPFDIQIKWDTISLAYIYLI